MQIANPNVRRNLKASVLDGASHGGMVGIGETYFAPFALALGMGEVSAGLVASLPLVAGGTLQLVSLHAVRLLGSEKRWILIAATLQSIAFFPLVYAAVSESLSLAGLLVLASLYWGAGLATGAAWNAWIETIVPVRIRSGFFAGRSKLAQLTTLGGFLLGGAILTVGAGIDQECRSFAILFAVAGILRVCSVYWLSQHHAIPQPAPAAVSVRNGTDGIRKSFIHGGRLLVFLVVLQGAVQLSGPFFTPFMLTELGFSYAEFVGLISVSFVSKALSLSLWRWVLRFRSATALLWIGSIGVVPVAGMWIISQHFLWLLLIQVVSGVMWAAHELGFFLVFFEALPKEKRVRMLTIYNFANTLAISVGALIGASLLTWMGATVMGYLVLFALSSVARLLALIILAFASFATVPILKIDIRVLGLRPGSGSVDTPVLSSFENEDLQPPVAISQEES